MTSSNDGGSLPWTSTQWDQWWKWTNDPRRVMRWHYEEIKSFKDERDKLRAARKAEQDTSMLRYHLTEIIDLLKEDLSR